MAQFDVYPNPEPSQRNKIPYLLDLQCDLLQDLNTRVVAPLYDVAVVNRPQVRGLTPIFAVEGRQVVMVTPELAGIPVRRLPPKIDNLANERSAIIAAIDVLSTGA
jgi:toxin CcdB